MSVKSYFEGVMKILTNPHQQKYYQWLVDNLKPMKCEVLTGEDFEYVDNLIKEIRQQRGRKKFPQMKECYMNAILLSMMSDGRITYVDGYYHSLITTTHGWCKINGKYFDPTQQWNNKDITNNDYMGMEVSKEDIKKYVFEKNNGYCSITEQKGIEVIESD